MSMSLWLCYGPDHSVAYNLQYVNINIMRLFYGFYKMLNHFPCSAFYEKEAMLMDPVDGPILASLLGIYKPH